MQDGPLTPAKTGPSSLVLRVVSAAVLLPLVIFATWLGEWPFAILAFAAAMLMLHEWLRMPGPYARSVLIGSRLGIAGSRSEEHTSELQSLMRISYAVFCLKKKKIHH